MNTHTYRHVKIESRSFYKYAYVYCSPIDFFTYKKK